MLSFAQKIQFFLRRKIAKRDSCQNCLSFNGIELCCRADGTWLTTIAKTDAIAGACPAAPAVARFASGADARTQGARGGGTGTKPRSRRNRRTRSGAADRKSTRLNSSHLGTSY